MTSEIWTRELIRRRRALHAQLDRLAVREPEGAARLRLALHTLRAEAEAGAVGRAPLDTRLAELEQRAERASALLAA